MDPWTMTAHYEGGALSMRTFLAVWSIVCVLYGVFVLFLSPTTVHEIEAGLAFMIATIAGGTAALLDEVVILVE